MVIVPRSADKGFTVAFQPSWDMVFTMVFSVASVMVYDIVLEVMKEEKRKFSAYLKSTELNQLKNVAKLP